MCVCVCMCVCGCGCVFVTTACEGKLRELLDKAARRTHTQMPTFMTGEREREEGQIITKLHENNATQ